MPAWPGRMSHYGHMEKDQKGGTAGKRNIMNKSKVMGIQDVWSGNTSNSI